MKSVSLKRTAAFCLAAASVMSLSANCFAAEWKETSKGMTYINDSGKAVTGMQEIDGETYYFSSKGIMSVGSVKISKSYYFFGEDGVMLTGWQDVNGTDYYYGKDGKRVVNKTVTIDGKKYKFDKNGKVKSSGSTSSKSTSSKVEEKIYPEEIIVTDTEFSMYKGQKFRLSYNFKPITTNCKEVKFVNYDKNIVSVNSKGDIEALEHGKATVLIESKDNPSAYVYLYITVE